MTAAVQWGVKHAASIDRQNHVDVRESETAARKWLHALQTCANNDGVLVSRGPGGDWTPVRDGGGHV